MSGSQSVGCVQGNMSLSLVQSQTESPVASPLSLNPHIPLFPQPFLPHIPAFPYLSNPPTLQRLSSVTSEIHLSLLCRIQAFVVLSVGDRTFILTPVPVTFVLY